MNKSNKKIDTLRFIELYRSHEVLWNINLPSYRRNDERIRAYKDISAEMEMSFIEVKKKIKSLRTAYSAEKAKIEKSLKFGCEGDAIYTPTLFWYNEMAFVDDLSIDNSNPEYISSLIETSLDSERTELSLPESFCKVEITPQVFPKKRKRSPKPKPVFDDDLDKLITINKGADVFETFGQNVARQIKEFPEEDAYKLMADIQLMLSKRKINLLRKDRDANLK